ncbi:helix-turn-helix domain-containing protein [Pseudobacteriovorax antillogorgiicola]|uniref:Cro/C1-type HTH DNA-binding domain-containing protein n=2 Tax=Pseudobacteriovorax antillogorgiicola TaxID=1513793 RepID=A0A1Y6BB13_9BACT|nr:helix-turn-helix domain-containing protein [Pseudobacteriovorax antillogorgiicola]TCS57446.1 Cro/C1-type helix-turn-helix DNA-binding protein [Pseudobacteriovorax antillogorgiicola]SMF00906.1 Cro/C1-type HTH DNA-binding domain-containing protein [Pseudobacteriovorax antillogorgiicola]
MDLKPSTAIIDPEAVKARIAELDLKKWWIAEQIRVDRKTVSRWLNGQVKWVKVENLEALAEILELDVNDISLKSEANLKASAADYKKAAELISSKDMKSMVRSTYNWQLLEYVIKTSMTEELPQDLIGALYLDLAQAFFFQNKIKESAEYVDKCLNIARQLDHELLYWDAMAVKAMTETCFGNIKKAIEYYKRCLNEDPESSREWKNLSNLSGALMYAGEFEEALAVSEAKIQDFQSRKDSQVDEISWAISYLANGSHLADCKHYDRAKESYDKAAEFSERARFSKGIHYTKILRANLESQFSPNEALAVTYEAAHKVLRTIQDDHLYYYYGARIYRSLDQFSKARDLLSEAIQMGRHYPIEKGMFLTELMHTEFSAENHAEAESAYRRAKQSFKKSDATTRLALLQDEYRNCKGKNQY